MEATMGKSKAPAPDPRIGQAAVMSAEIGNQYLTFMRERAAVTDQWAEEERTRYRDVFIPAQDAYIREAQGWDSPERQASEAAKARADVETAVGQSRGRRERQLAAMGVSPASGRFAATERAADLTGALAAAGAENLARDRVRAQGMDMRANVVNMGSGLAVNPLSAMQAGSGAAASGFGGAMSGQGQMASILNTDFQNRFQRWAANQQSQSSLFGALGSVAGMAIASDEKKKTAKKPSRGNLAAIEELRIDDWTYKKGAGDEGRHTGTYAQDFKKATGRGDGLTIPVVDAIGVTMGAVKELSAKVEKMARTLAPREGLAA
jgi:hypothetical protein